MILIIGTLLSIILPLLLCISAVRFGGEYILQEQGQLYERHNQLMITLILSSILLSIVLSPLLILSIFLLDYGISSGIISPYILLIAPGIIVFSIIMAILQIYIFKPMYYKYLKPND